MLSQISPRRIAVDACGRLYERFHQVNQVPNPDTWPQRKVLKSSFAHTIEVAMFDSVSCSSGSDATGLDKDAFARPWNSRPGRGFDFTEMPEHWREEHPHRMR